MKLTKGQLKQIIRKTIKESNDIYPRPQHPMISQAQANNHEGLMARAVQACKDAGLTMEEIIYLCEQEIMEQDV